MRSIDPATPEAYPDVFIPGKCFACTSCWLDIRSGRCICAGPYDTNLRVARVFVPKTARPY